MHRRLWQRSSAATAGGAWQSPLVCHLARGQHEYFDLNSPDWIGCKWPEKSWKHHLDEAAASPKQRARIVLIRSINNGQNNTFPGEDDIQAIFNPWKDLNRCGTSAKIFNSTAKQKNQISMASVFSISLHLTNNPNPVWGSIVSHKTP